MCLLVYVQLDTISLPELSRWTETVWPRWWLRWWGKQTISQPP